MASPQRRRSKSLISCAALARIPSAKSHAASFAVLTYQSAWFKLHHPAIFYAAILNHQPMGFWSPSTLVYDAMRNGITALPPHINRSDADCAIHQGAIRIGLKYVKGLKD